MIFGALKQEIKYGKETGNEIIKWDIARSDREKEEGASTVRCPLM